MNSFSTAATSDYIIWGITALVVIIAIALIILFIAKRKKDNDENQPTTLEHMRNSEMNASTGRAAKAEDKISRSKHSH